MGASRDRAGLGFGSASCPCQVIDPLLFAGLVSCLLVRMSATAAPGRKIGNSCSQAVCQPIGSVCTSVCVCVKARMPLFLG